MSFDPTPPIVDRYVGYARVSMRDQSNDRQMAALKEAGCAMIFSDKASGRNMKRPGWVNCWRHLRKNDVLVVLAVDRLGRNLIDIIGTVSKLHERGIGLRVLSGAIDTTTASGRFMLSVIAAIAEWERETIIERTKHGLEVARGRGRAGGREQTISDEQVVEAFRRRDEDGASIKAISEDYGVSANALYKRHKEMGAEAQARKPARKRKAK